VSRTPGRLRKEGRLGCGPGGEERAIPKSVITYRLRRALKTLEYAHKRPTSWATLKRCRPAKRYPVMDEMRGSFFPLRERKLKGEWLDEGDWHSMVDMANAMNDPMLSALLKSP
jgi:hypothetical protein